MSIPQTDGAGASSNHCYRVKAALRKSGLPFELKNVINVMADLVCWQTGRTDTVKISQAELADALSCDVRTLRRYQNAIKALPGKPWATWKRNAGANGIGRGIDDFAVHVGDPITAEEAKRITRSGRTQADKTTDPSGQIDRPKRITRSDPLITRSLDQIERAEKTDALTNFSSKSEKQIGRAATPPPADLITSLTYLALGDARGLDRHVTITELQKLANHDADRRRTDWTFRAGEWLDKAVEYRNEKAKPKLTLVSPAQDLEIAKAAAARTATAYERKKRSDLLANEQFAALAARALGAEPKAAANQ